jgi:hypothetical protein
MDNSMFSGGEPTWANACVGENGAPGYLDYAKGFSKAAKILIDKALEDLDIKHSVDELVYPVCFNMRHSVELRLKGAISELTAIERARGSVLEFDLDGSHDIGKIWEFFVKKSNSSDDRYVCINARLAPLILDIAAVDPTGQTFRYPDSNDKQKHLVEVRVINFFKLQASFLALETALDDLHLLNVYLLEEFRQGTFTAKLSRKKIFDIADQLPNHKEWSNPAFDQTRAGIKSKYVLSANEFSRCLNRIKSHFELAPLIGIDKPLLGATDDEIVTFVSNWLKLHDRTSDTLDSEARVNEMIRYAAMLREIWNAMGPQLTPEMLAGFRALFYFAREMEFSERYVRIYASELLEASAAHKRSDDEVKTLFFSILSKTNALDNFLKSLYFLQKNELAERLVSARRYCYRSQHPWRVGSKGLPDLSTPKMT